MAKLIYIGYENDLGPFSKEIREINWDNSADCSNNNFIINDLPLVVQRKFTLWQSLGYGFYVKPLSMLGFYNAIANNGRMVQSRRAGVVGSTVTINKQICSKATLKALQQCLTKTVEGGTGKLAQSKLVKIAGVSGTVQEPYADQKRQSYSVSFCGYFPVEEPKYTCIVVLRDPKNGIPSGGGMAGVVVKEVAEWLTVKK